MGDLLEWLVFWLGFWIVPLFIPTALLAGGVFLVRRLMRQGKEERAVLVVVILVPLTVIWLALLWGIVRKAATGQIGG